MQIRSSIHDRLVIRIGFSLAVLLLGLFFVIITAQKEAIIGKHRIVATTMIQTAIIPINDALYLSASNSADYLQSFINNFTRKYRDQIKYAIILDQSGTVLAHSDVSQDQQIYTDIYSLAALEAIDPVFHIYEDAQYGWVLEVSAPLGLVSLSHGAVRMGLDAQPMIRELRTTALLIMLLFAGILILVIVIVLQITHSVTRKLRHTVHAIDTFDFQTAEPLPLLESDDEIGLLNDRFSNLQKRLIAARSTMEKTNKSLIQTEKLAAMGRMAAGVAHEINNPLLGLKNCLHLLKIDPENSEDHMRLLKEGLDRIEVIVSRLLEGARKKTGTIREFDVNLSVRDVLNLLAHRLSKEKVITQVQLSDNLPVLSNNKSGFEEALLNIGMNAMDAIGGIGTIRITTDEQDGNISIVVEDSGIGIPDEIQSTMFEPFVTTKEVGKGTGLGLYVTREIIESMGGRISYSSSNLGGAQFRIDLPVDMHKP
ncbi:MAG: ATP-binding protein [Candidatus Marinimicrobia bacterium]|nr:ATP-binding protein [Candidatus Neomarinimicrobiota bacterium]